MNQHFVSQVLLKRFRRPGHALLRYRIETNEWKPRSPEKVFSVRGWNQLRCFGQLDDSLEAAFSKVESLLPDTFRFLEQAPQGKRVSLPKEIHQNLAQYCSFLWLTSPFAKAKAPADLVQQINHDLEHNEFATLLELGFDMETIRRFADARRKGYHAILYSDDCLQLVYRIQFRQLHPSHLGHFLYWTEWALCDSPITLPLSDVALVQVHQKNEGATYYLLPIAPHLLLRARCPTGSLIEPIPAQLRRETLSSEEAEYWFQAICLSAVSELVAVQPIQNVPGIRHVARINGIGFTTIVNPQRGVDISLSDFNSQFGFRMVSDSEYVRYIHSFLRPPETLTV